MYVLFYFYFFLLFCIITFIPLEPITALHIMDKAMNNHKLFMKLTFSLTVTGSFPFICNFGKEDSSLLPVSTRKGKITFVSISWTRTKFRSSPRIWGNVYELHRWFLAKQDPVKRDQDVYSQLTVHQGDKQISVPFLFSDTQHLSFPQIIQCNYL